MSIVAEDRLERNFVYQRLTGWASGIAVPLISVILALIIGAGVVIFTGGNPLDAYKALAQGAVGTPYDASETLVSAIPLMLAGMAVAFAFRAGLFNIGAEGQLFIGAVCSSVVGFKLNLPGYLLIPLALLAAVIGGGVWGGIAGVLKATRGAHEVITTVMLNYVAIFVTGYLLESTPSGKPGPLAQHNLLGNPQTPPMNATLPVIVPNALVANGRLHAGLIVALAAGVICWFTLWRTTLGYKIRAVGLSPKAAAYAGMNVGWLTVVSMFVAGAFAGLAGMVAVFGLFPYQLTESFSPGYGFDAIAVALLGRNTVFGTFAAAILFGAFAHGGSLMQANAGVSGNLVNVLQGLIIFFIGADALVRYLTRRGVIRGSRVRRQEAAA